MTYEDQSVEARKRRETADLRAELESKSTEELFLATLDGEYDDDSPWEAVHVLQGRGIPEVFEVAKRFCASENPKARARGLSILAQLGAGSPDVERPFMDDSVSIAVGHIRDSDPEAVRCAAWALSHLGTQQAVLSLIELRNHWDPEVRQAVAFCIPLRKHPEAVSVILALMDDRNEEVRDWATFALGSGSLDEGGGLHYVDSTEIREAFRKRLGNL
jgi:HEAT repeat protein